MYKVRVFFPNINNLTTKAILEENKKSWEGTRVPTRHMSRLRGDMCPSQELAFLI